jgi:hypothetical protein
MAQKKPNPHDRKTRYQLFKEILKHKLDRSVIVFKEVGNGTLAAKAEEAKRRKQKLIDGLIEEFNKRKPSNDECAVAVVSNIYELKPPYTGCKIIWKGEKFPPLHEVVFTGTYEECVDFVNNNCRK